MSLRKKATIIKLHCSHFQPETYGYSLISDNMVDYMSRETFLIGKSQKCQTEYIFLSFFDFLNYKYRVTI